MATRDVVMRKFGPFQIEAFALAAHNENNNLRSWVTDFKVAVAAATSLSDLQSRIAGLPNMPERTTQQLLDAVDTDIDNTVPYSWMGA